jgi:surface protein
LLLFICDSHSISVCDGLQSLHKHHTTIFHQPSPTAILSPQSPHNHKMFTIATFINTTQNVYHCHLPCFFPSWSLTVYRLPPPCFQVFINAELFNADISSWDVSSVTRMNNSK